MSKLPFAIRNPALLDEFEPYLVATPFNLPLLDPEPFGMPTPPQNVLNPLALSSEPFLTLLHRLDGLTFGPEGMPMPRWVFFDCSEMPGAIYGLARRASTLWPGVRDLFKLPADFDGLVPVSMYVAIPMQRPGQWFGHNLSSLAPVFNKLGAVPLDLRGLGSLTKGLALQAFGVREFWGATQWTSKALHIHAKFGPLALQTAYTPAHSEHETLTYGFHVTEAALRASMGDPSVVLARPPVDFWLDSADVAGMIALQDRIEAGGRFVIPGAPRLGATGRAEVPIAELAAAAAATPHAGV
ncbi:MAG: hypothetical protein EXR79_16110 [Myxococcales bacterium]|nr:hypothetical protein [Myxococcales bacterium]